MVTGLLLGSPVTASSASKPAWEKWLHVPGVLDVAGPARNGRVIVAARGRLRYLDPSGSTSPFAPAYAVGPSPESYMTMSPGVSVARARCTFPRDAVYALDLRSKPPGVTAVTANGIVSRLARVGGASGLNGITMDTVGTFDHRLLVVEKRATTSRVFAVDCKGGVETIGVVNAPIEGGVAVAPPGFGPFGGQLIAPDEIHGILYAIAASGKVSVVARPNVAAGPDIGVESVGFVPRGTIGAAYVADRGTPKSANPHPGTDSVLRLDGATLRSAGVVAGDLLVATEGAGTLVNVHCATSCASTVIATGPPEGHIEGHILVIGAQNPLGTAPAVPASSGGSNAYLVWTVVLVVGVIVLLVVIGKLRGRTNP